MASPRSTRATERVALRGLFGLAIGVAAACGNASSNSDHKSSATAVDAPASASPSANAGASSSAALPLATRHPHAMDRATALQDLAGKGSSFFYAVRALTADGDAEAVQALRAAAEREKKRPIGDDDYERDYILRLALFASPDVEAMKDAVLDVVPSVYTSANPVVEGLVLRDEASPLPIPTNPFHITAEMNLPQAIDAAWSPLRTSAPGFIAKLKQRLLGIALLRGKEPVLAYIFLRKKDRHERTHVWDCAVPENEMRRQLARMVRAGHARCVLGHAAGDAGGR